MSQYKWMDPAFFAWYIGKKLEGRRKLDQGVGPFDFEKENS